MGADGLIFQDLNDLVDAVREENPEINEFECSVFDGIYVTKDIDQTYLDYLENLRKDDELKIKDQNEIENLEIYNEG
ncbi:Amidophosphoribosyltransferase [Providencia stuartii]|nr:Amidophosphoribosyltransferase [Providencia stuartii]